MTQVVQQGETATLVGYPPSALRGAISAGTVRVGTPAVSLPDSGSAITVSSLDTTTSASATRGATSITATDATGATAGRIIGIGNLEAEIESVSGNTITLRLPLPQDVASGTAIKGHDLAISLSSAQTAEAGNAVALWHDTATGTEWTQTFIVGHRAVAYQLDSAGLRLRYPIVDRLSSSRDADLTDVIEASWLGEVQRHLLGHGLQPEEIRSWDQLNEWHAAAAAFRLVLNNPRMAPEELDKWGEIVASARTNALDSRRFWYAETEELGEQPDDPIGRSRISFRF